MQDLLKNPNFQLNLLRFNGAIPALLLLVDLAFGNLGANPPEAIIRTTGVTAIFFLAVTLAVTPLANSFKWSWLVKHRRWLGLLCFYYACLHLLAYTVFDKSLNFPSIFDDIKKRPFILLGFSAFVFLLPLAVTSTNQMIKRLGGKKWKNLHKLTYGIAVLTAIHYWLIVKSDLFYPKLFAAAFGLLLLYRVGKKVKALRST